MPQVVAVAVAAFQAAATVATTVGAAMGFSGIAATVAGAASIISSTTQMWSAISSAVSPKPKVTASASQLQTKVGAVTPRAIIMGRTAVAGTLLTPTPLQSGRGNALATNFYALSHAGPSGVVESVQWGDDTVTFDGQGQAIGKYANNMWLFQKNGDWNQTSISFAGTPGISADTPAAWDSTKRARGCLVVALVVRYAASVLANNMQTPLFVVDANAVALTDPRTGSAATTQAQRRNPAVWAYSWRLGWFQNSKRVIGMGQAASEVHAAGYAYAANVADANGWTIGGEATTADDRYAVESAILQVCAAAPVERNGLQSVVVSAVRSSVGTITSDDLRANPKWRYATQQTSRPTAIQTRYRSETNRWQMVEGAEVTDASWLTQDAGREKRVTVEYPYAAGGSAHVGHLAALDASNAREPLVFTLQCKQQARYDGFVGDAVTVSLPEIGLSSTKMTVISRVVNPDGTVDFELLVETDAKYAFAAGKTSAAPSFTLNPGFDIYSVPQPDSADWAVTAAQITSGATSLPIVRITGSAANYNFSSGLVFKLRLNSGGSPWLVSEDAPPAATQHEFRGLTNATSYIAGVAYRGVTGIEGPVRELGPVTTGTFVAGEAGAGVGGAPILNELIPQSGNIARFTEFEIGTTLSSLSGTAPVTTPLAIFESSGFRCLRAVLAPTAASQSAIITMPIMTVTPGQRYSLQLYLEHGGVAGSSQFVARWFNGATHLSENYGLGFATGVVGFISLRSAFLTAPANANRLQLFTLVEASGAGSMTHSVSKPCVTEARAGQTVHPPYSVGLNAYDAADVTGANTAAGFIGQGNQATTNIYRQATAPSSPNEGDIWEDTSTTPVSIRRRISGAWVFQGEEGADITAQAVPLLEGPASVTFDVDSVGALSPGSQVPRTLQFIRKRGNTDVSTTTTWSIVSPVNVTLGTITNGGVNITAIAAGNSSFTVRSVRDGVTIDYLVTIAKNTVVAAGAGSKGNFAASSNGISSSTFADIVTVSVGSTPAGVIDYAKSRFVPLTVGNPGGGSSFYRLQMTVNGTEVYQSATFQGVDSSGNLTPDWLEEVSAAFAYIGAFAGGASTHALRARRTSGTSWIDSSDALLFATVSVAT